MSGYTREQAQRDLNGHAAAVMASALWSQRYSTLGLGLMGFWDQLTNAEKRIASDLAKRVREARPYTGAHS